MQAVRWRAPVGALTGLVVMMAMAGCGRQDEAAAPASSTPGQVAEVATDAAPPVACHASLTALLDALPSAAVNGVRPVSRECKSGAVSVAFGPRAASGETFSYVLSTFQVDQSDLLSQGRKTGQKILDDLRDGLSSVVKAQKELLADARGDDNALTPQQRALLPQETRLPTGDKAVVFREEDGGWRMISFMGPHRALDIRWNDPQRPGLSSDEVVRVMLPLASEVKYEALSP